MHFASSESWRIDECAKLWVPIREECRENHSKNVENNVTCVCVMWKGKTVASLLWAVKEQHSVHCWIYPEWSPDDVEKSRAKHSEIICLSGSLAIIHIGQNSARVVAIALSVARVRRENARPTGGTSGINTKPLINTLVTESDSFIR